MKIVYICHPISGDVKGNIKKVTDIVRKINLEEPGFVPFAPYIVDLMALHDDVPFERARGIRNNITHFHKGIIDEVRVFGEKVSKGMAAEIELATKLNIPVFYADERF